LSVHVTVVATRAVPGNRQLVMELPDIEPGTLVTVLVVPANVAVPVVDANTARRKANGWLSDQMSVPSSPRCSSPPPRRS